MTCLRFAWRPLVCLAALPQRDSTLISSSSAAEAEDSHARDAQRHTTSESALLTANGSEVMWCVASVHETLHDLKNFAFTVTEQPTFSWSALKTNRDNYIKRLNNIYLNNLKNSGVTFFPAFARLAKPDATPNGGQAHSIILKSGDGKEETVTADHVLIASGGRPVEAGIPGEEHTINSDGFFELEEMPKKVALIGAGYVAVELAGVFAAMRAETHLFVRRECALRKFDDMISSRVDEFMKKAGVQVHPHSNAKAVHKDADDSLTLELTDGRKIGGFESIIVTIGRVPEVEGLGLQDVGVKQVPGAGYIQVDEFQNTSVKQIYALGDVCGKLELTPVAIAAGRRLADRLFGDLPNAKLEYGCVPTVIFSHPPAASVGLTEAEAKATYGEEDIKVYTGTSVNLYYGAWPVAPEEKPKTFIKMICVKSLSMKVVGLHVVGMGADEMIQGFGVAIKMGATKADFDNCVAVHPTAAEEVVTLAPWGLSHKGM
ncbi:glutathione reductase [Besnoitia besnoiti]|uniref:Glutathione reductase n=1 Tax=Besnoitia besnoiti TaxID=94643 RepID=A0A2A9MQ36_BESBE|nr:glutathione reductase [Besnoitia besnoiti]PFH38273.1 glutathione reductase [Besnoitia besnoiti]